MHELYKEKSVQGRYVTLSDLSRQWLPSIPEEWISDIGKSENGKRIYSIKIGSGSQKILMWSQMHGNESTTTKAVMDLVNFLQTEDNQAKKILENCQLLIVPMLNPDGAEAYTRVNFNGVDLNRDAQNRSQAETKVLWSVFDSFQPDFCFNLHDQRTLFNVGGTNKVATVSFLSPASDARRAITESRCSAMRLIVGMNQKLQQYIPGQVGRYDDSFNANCIGDSFQMEQVPTVLFEAGHYSKDYQREETRKLIYISLLEALDIISESKIESFDIADYAKIPENEKQFFDVLIRNAQVVNLNIEVGDAIGIRYEEVLEKSEIQFKPKIEEVGELNGFYGHLELDVSKVEDFDSLSEQKEIVDLIISL